MVSLTANYNAVLKKVQAQMTTLSTVEQIHELAISAKDLTSSHDQFEAERILAFHLRPDCANNDFQETVFTAWKDLIRKLDISNYPRSVPLIAAMSAKFEYIPLEDPRHGEFHTFRRAIEAPHNAAHAKAMLQFGD